MADSKKRLALAIIDFLNTSLKDGTLQTDDAESMEIATSCIAEAFHVDPTDKPAMTDALGGQNLLGIYSVYEKLKGKTTAGTDGGSSSSSAKESPLAPGPATGGPATTTPESETLKGKGNAAMQKKDYASAVEAYTRALELAPLNPIYLSNRAAAFSAMNEHRKAQNDAEMATAADPAYTKAWSRLGLAKFALGDARGAMLAYGKGIEAEGRGGSEAMKKGFETAKRRVEEEEEGGAGGSEAGPGSDDVAARGAGAGAGAGGMPDLASLAGMFGGGGGEGGGGGAGGMPDLSALMQNPMMRSMAQNMMSNPDMMNNLMNNPTVRNMASRFGGGQGGQGGEGGQGGQGGGGGGMPDLSALMNDPSIAEMARNFMGGAGGAGRGAGQ